MFFDPHVGFIINPDADIFFGHCLGQSQGSEESLTFSVVLERKFKKIICMLLVSVCFDFSLHEMLWLFPFRLSIVLF